eukprot:3069125-Prymnesium_polylepis.1
MKLQATCTNSPVSLVGNVLRTRQRFPSPLAHPRPRAQTRAHAPSACLVPSARNTHAETRNSLPQAPATPSNPQRH